MKGKTCSRKNLVKWKVNRNKQLIKDLITFGQYTITNTQTEFLSISTEL